MGEAAPPAVGAGEFEEEEDWGPPLKAVLKEVEEEEAEDSGGTDCC